NSKLETRNSKLRPMRLTFISLISWLLGLSVIAAAFLFYEGDLAALAADKVTVLASLAMTALLFSLAYAPMLSWLERRLGGCRPAALFPVASAFVINIPIFVIGILAIGRTLSGAEAFAFISAFVLMGSVFGLGFVWTFHSTGIQSAAWRQPKHLISRPRLRIRLTSLL
ncbi:MAG TPA: hypothetical protein VJT50_03925, partial [Pyrinomonadaceae bacterium]|nr:hypothetical protein [Pyrinomonadaceae bacterium]